MSVKMVPLILAIFLCLSWTDNARSQGAANNLSVHENNSFRLIEGTGIQKVNVLNLLVTTPLELSGEQRKKIEAMLQLQYELEDVAHQQFRKFRDQFPIPRSEDDISKIEMQMKQLIVDRQQSRMDLERRIAELLTDEQLGRLRTAAKAAALARFNDFNELVATALKQKDVKVEFEADTFERQQEILARYRERLRKLQAETVDELLRTLPAEARQATEELMALDVLKRNK